MSNDFDSQNPDPAVTILQNITAHPEQLPTFDELDYFNPSLSASTLRATLGHLIDKGEVERIETETGTFYGLTAECREHLEEMDLTRAERTLQEATLLTERTPEIEEKMQLERPDWGPAKPYDGGRDE